MSDTQLRARSMRPNVVLFGSFEVNLASGELRKGGVRLKLPEQSFRVLEALLEQPGEIISREQLQKRLWSPNTHVSYERNLNTIVHTLRVALGDSARNPRFVETVHGRGYRLLSPVRIVQRSSPPAPDPAKPSSRSWIAKAAGLAAAVALGFWLAADSPYRPATAAEPLLPTPVTSYVGVEAGPAFSPDGSSIAFHWDGGSGGAFDIYLKQTGNESARRLTSDPADEINPAWSPDGRTLAFVRRLPGYRAAVILLTHPNGDERLLTTLDTNETTLSWSSDGRWIVYSNAYPDYLRRNAAEAGVMAVEVRSGRNVEVTAPEPLTQGDSFAALSPRGGTLAFVRGVSNASGDIHLIDVDRDMRPLGAPRRLTSDATSFRSLAWSRDGAELYFVSSRSSDSSAMTMWRLSLRAGTPSEPIPLGSSSALDVTVSPTNGQIVFASPIDSQNLWRLEVDAEGGSALSLERITRSTSVNRGPSLSPDGQRIAFESNRSGLREIWVAAADGSDPRQVSSFGGPNSGTPQWSPDSRRLVVDSRVDGYGDIFVLDADGGPQRRLTQRRGDDIVPSWSRDGQWVYFASNRTGRYEIWKTPAAGGDPVQVTRGGGFHGHESIDGKTLYYAKSITETSLWKVPVAGGDETLVLDSLGEWSNFAPVRRGVFYFAAPVKRRTALHFYDFETGASRQVHEVDAPLNGGLTALEDGSILVFSRPETPQSDLMTMQLPSEFVWASVREF